ncbi:hypothetical protein [Bradyrhizobium sp.]|uniref:hypothetical protein n=1 Tax=Bradyrhizobium sp. TaxID=376 RepID=UPI001E049CD1|nr:hypothetical protein [Bradyrhizobium sp.]MBI5319185.1 hypothetical protein [Bradyrhizobium sp.]
MSNFAARSILKGLLLSSLSVILAGGSAVAVTTDDVKWINQCVKDNSDQGAKRLVVLKYCTCMNNKMTDEDTQSVTEWEKTHPEEQKACEEEAGWE